jgi:hypothetical protein
MHRMVGVLLTPPAAVAALSMAHNLQILLLPTEQNGEDAAAANAAAAEWVNAGELDAGCACGTDVKRGFRSVVL